jgi:hypothetical protein
MSELAMGACARSGSPELAVFVASLGSNDTTKSSFPIFKGGTKPLGRFGNRQNIVYNQKRRNDKNGYHRGGVNFHARYPNCFHNFQPMSKEALKNFNGLSQVGR